MSKNKTGNTYYLDDEFDIESIMREFGPGSDDGHRSSDYSSVGEVHFGLDDDAYFTAQVRSDGAPVTPASEAEPERTSEPEGYEDPQPDDDDLIEDDVVTDDDGSSEYSAKTDPVTGPVDPLRQTRGSSGYTPRHAAKKPEKSRPVRKKGWHSNKLP